MRGGLLAPAQLLEALAERVVGVVRRRVEDEQPFERLARALVLAGVEVRPTERLDDRGLVRLESIGEAPLMYDPTAYESTGAPAPRK